jgi:hypothetical protein
MIYKMVAQEVTYMGLHKWFAHLFEKNSWVLISDDEDRKSQHDKELQKFIKIATNKISTLKEEDRQNELKIMIGKIQDLINANKRCVSATSATQASEEAVARPSASDLARMQLPAQSGGKKRSKKSVMKSSKKSSKKRSVMKGGKRKSKKATKKASNKRTKKSSRK